MSLLRRRAMMAVDDGGGGASYNSLVDAAAPLLWWKLEETSGTAAADSSGNGYGGTLSSSNFGAADVSVIAPSGYDGIGRGVNFNILGGRVYSANNAALALGGSSSSAWTLIVWMAGSSGGSQYIANRQNDMGLIYNYVAGTVEFNSTYTGSNPRTGSGISLPTGDTTTPHMIVYRYDNGQWAGFKDGANVFDVSRSFSLGTSVQHWNLGSADSSNQSKCRMWDFQVYGRALTDTEISDMYAARDIA